MNVGLGCLKSPRRFYNSGIAAVRLPSKRAVNGNTITKFYFGKYDFFSSHPAVNLASSFIDFIRFTANAFEAARIIKSGRYFRKVLTISTDGFVSFFFLFFFGPGKSLKRPD